MHSVQTTTLWRSPGRRANLEALGLEAELRELDARLLDGWGASFDAIVTDLPYGVSASLGGEAMNELYGEILEASALVLRRGGVAVFAAPAGALTVPSQSFAILECHREFVHQSLIRETTVLCRR